jgi:hypothetical protein
MFLENRGEQGEERSANEEWASASRVRKGAADSGALALAHIASRAGLRPALRSIVQSRLHTIEKVQKAPPLQAGETWRFLLGSAHA